jgi:hypothetical protein
MLHPIKNKAHKRMEPKKIHNNPGLLHADTSPWAQTRPRAAGASGRLLQCCYYTPCHRLLELVVACYFCLSIYHGVGVVD